MAAVMSLAGASGPKRLPQPKSSHWLNGRVEAFRPQLGFRAR